MKYKTVFCLIFIIIIYTFFCGCVRKERDNSIPIARFTIDPNKNIYVNNLIEFTDNSVDKDGKITKWMWDFGDNTTSNQKNPFHIYNITGNFTIILQVIDDYDDLSKKTYKNITVSYKPPKALFNTEPIFLNNITMDTKITFIDSSIPGDGNITEYFWDLGDGNSSNLSTFIYSYSNPGIYIVTFTVTDENEEKDTTEKITIEVL